MNIKFGTDGWRAIIGDDYTLDNLARITQATATWLLSKISNPLVVIGYDCRFGGLMFSQTVAKILTSNGIRVIESNSFSSTPMVSFGTHHLKADLGIVITASHNPSSFNGFKLKGAFGGPLLVEDIQAIENLIESNPPKGFRTINNLKSQQLIETISLHDLYKKHLEHNFDLALIEQFSHQFIYDAMFGAGQEIMDTLFPDMNFLNNEINPSFNNTPPEPIDKNLQTLSQIIKLSDGEILSGLATDGDADRIGLYDEHGNFVDSHHIILLLIHYLVSIKKLTGKVIFTCSVTPKVAKLCEHFGLKYTITKVGFKYIAKHMVEEDVLLGGEESGGIAIKGHIPERDGIFIGLTLWSFMLNAKKTLSELVQDIYDIVGSFCFEREDLNTSEKTKQSALEYLKADSFNSFGSLQIIKKETIDGYKYFFDNDEWVMIRPSGTEPVLRAYAEASTKKRAKDILEIVKSIITN